MDTRKRSFRILMLPWLAHGHISPFLELAKALTKRNFYIYVCSTPVNLSSLKQNLSEKDSISIKLVELQVPTLPELPPHHHTTNGLPPNLMPTLKEAVDMAKPSFHNILRTLKPDMVLYDFLLPWVPALASAQNIPAVSFISTGAATFSYVVHYKLNPDSEYPFSSIYYREYENHKLTGMADATASGIKDSDRVINCVEQSSGMILIKTCREIEGKYIDYLSRLSKKKIVPVGPLVQAPAMEDAPTKIIEWLSKKNRGSTVFASFGSEYFLSREDMEQIAFGLELSNVNFIWVIRFPVGEDISLKEALPKGFLERVGHRAMVLKGWAPQGRILKHPSIGGFVSHCGWSSVMEGIKFGVPIVAVPMHLDQPLNARLVEELGIGEEVVRNKQGILEKEQVSSVIRKVVDEKSTTGERFRRKVRELSEKMRGKEEEEIDDVVEEMVKPCRKVDRYNSVDMLF
ncbi:UDP-glucosyltransferase 29 [Coffea arabica]|uniref:Glycosyltransferase n=1 Tax=Coffea arabica TaxID=13443 RepID=A0A6P6VQL5_COFAR|nr:beta-D-glucosyl crocetin beta-1,6-glucosyltransferase-like [Coffea arabica]